jgi:hypothetical protein
MENNNDVSVVGESTMPEERQQVIADWFAQQDHDEEGVGVLEVANWLKGVFGGEWVVSKMTQQGTVNKHWIYCTSVNESWIELSISDDWFYTLFRIK